MNNSYAVGVDMGGTKIAFALINRKGEVLDSYQMPTLPKREPDAIIADIASGISRMINKAPGGKLDGIGIGSPGQILADKGVIINAFNLGWKEVFLTDQLHSILKGDIPIWVTKDADASLLGEYYYGAAQGISDFMYICIGSGLGGAIMSNNQLVKGIFGTAAGIGHILLGSNDRLCACGLRGCAETLVSGPGLVKITQDLINHLEIQTVLINDASLTSYAILSAVRAGDPLARRALSTLTQGLGLVISLCISILNPEMIVLGGGLALASFDIIIPEVMDEIKKHALPHTYQALKLQPAKLPSSAIGPACLVWHSATKDPFKKEVITNPVSIDASQLNVTKP